MSAVLDSPLIRNIWHAEHTKRADRTGREKAALERIDESPENALQFRGAEESRLE